MSNIFNNISRRAFRFWYGRGEEGVTLGFTRADAMVQMEEGRLHGTYEEISSAMNRLPVKTLPRAFVDAAAQISRLPIGRKEEEIHAIHTEALLDVYANETDRKELSIGKPRKLISAWFDGISLSAAISGSFAALLAFETLHLTFLKLLSIISIGCSLLFLLAAYQKWINIKIIQKAWLMSFGAYNAGVSITDKLIEAELEILGREIGTYHSLEERYNTHGRNLTEVVRDRYGNHFELPFVGMSFVNTGTWRRNTVFGDRLNRYLAKVADLERWSNIVCPVPEVNWDQEPNRFLKKSLNIETGKATKWFKSFREITPALGAVGILGVVMAYWGGTSSLKQTYNGDSSAWRTPQALIGTMGCLILLATGYLVFNKVNGNQTRKSQDKVSNCKHLYGEEKDMLSSLRDARAFMQTLLRYAERIVPSVENNNDNAPAASLLYRLGSH